ncbi:MAG: flippase-like domain-containing protein [Phycisphaerae bacterium]|nr:flippase-like domain-containing protein [Phycisphaerae bacterium]
MTDGRNTTKKSYASLIIRLAIAGVACWIIYQKIDPGELAGAFERLRLSTLLLAVLVFNAGVCLIGTRWWVFMRAQDIRVPLFLAIKLIFLGQFFTNFMPSAVGGDVVRAWYVSRHTHKRLQAALGVAVDRLMGLAATFILAITSYLLFMRGQGIFQVSRKGPSRISAFFDRHPVSVYQVLLIVIIFVGILFFFAGFFNLKQFFKRIYGHFIHLFGQLKEVLFVYYHHPLVLIFGLLVTILLQSAVILSLWLVGRDLGMSAEIRFYFVFFPMVWVIGSIPVSIAGIGILEGGIILLFVQFTGAAPEAGIALALCQRLTWVIASVPGMAVHLSGSHRHKEQSG